MFEALAQNPNDEEAAAKLESMLDLGADPGRLAEGFFELAKELRAKDDPAHKRAVPSSEVVTKRRPSGLNATWITGASCPCNTCAVGGDAPTSHKRTV